MTVREVSIGAAAIPFCHRCKGRVATRTDDTLWRSLLYVHNAWSAAGV